MATTTGATTPRSEPFHPSDHAPRTPTSLPSVAHSTYTFAKDSPRISRPLPVGRASPSPKTPRQAFSPRSSPQPLTGAVALADARRAEQEKARQGSRQSSPNPNAVALRALMGSTGMSKASDAPSTSRVSEPMQRAAEKLTTTYRGPSQESQHNVASTTKNSSNDRAMTATASTHDDAPQFVEEPESMENNEVAAPGEQDGSYRPFTYPGPMPASQRDDAASRRDMSLPGSAYEQSPKSSSTKRHKCPYCSTDFTRHHNLKSHLLTHSQEKPYVCQTCQARFRRLHDLKRHAKLHTGERPHTCPKCGRRFARGDALARHNKGPGGCAGRRSSFGGDDDGGEGGDDGMDGLEYQDDGSDERGEGEMLDASGRRVSEPMSRKRARPDSSYDSSRSVYRPHSSTYPPPPGQSRAQGRPDGTMGPPQSGMPPGGPAEHSTGPTTAESSYTSQIYAPPAASGYPSVAITESPQPLSPANMNQQRLSISEQAGFRNRSPSLTQSYQQQQQQQHHQQQQHYGRSHPPPQPHMSSHAPQLPSLSGLAQGLQQSRTLPLQSQPLPSQPMSQHPPQHPTGGHASGSNSLSSHGHSSGGSMRDFVGPDPQEIWNYIRNLEQRFSRMQDEYELRISRLQEDVISLKGHAYQGR